jgi:hypothetical protein
MGSMRRFARLLAEWESREPADMLEGVETEQPREPPASEPGPIFVPPDPLPG